MTKPQILQRIAGGDPDAVRDCICQYGALVWSLARRFTKTPADAEDATQEVFLEIWVHAGRFDHSLGSEQAFIAVIARRRLIDRWRKAVAEPLMDSSAEVLESLTWMESGNTLEICDEAEQAMQALAGLRPEYRQVLELGCLHCLTHVQIANRLGLPLGTVKSYMRRGLMSVRKCLDEDVTSAAPKPRRRPSGAFKKFPVNPYRLDRPAVPMSKRRGIAFSSHGVAHFEFQPSHAFRLGVDEVPRVEHDPVGSAMPCVV